MNKLKALVRTEVQQTILLINEAVENRYIVPGIEEPLAQYRTEVASAARDKNPQGNKLGEKIHFSITYLSRLAN